MKERLDRAHEKATDGIAHVIVLILAFGFPVIAAGCLIYGLLRALFFPDFDLFGSGF